MPNINNNSKTKLRLWRGIILSLFFGWSIASDFSFDPAAAAFELRPHRSVPSRRSKNTTTITTTPSVGGNSNNKNCQLTKLLAYSLNQNRDRDATDKSSSRRRRDGGGTTKSKSIEARTISVLRNAFSFARPTTKAPTVLGNVSLPSNLQKIAAILACSFALVRLLGLFASPVSSWYMGLLEWSPLGTKTVTTGTIAVVGDTVAQYFETTAGPSSKQPKPPGSANTDITATTTESSIFYPPGWFQNKYDRRRGLSVFGEGIFVSGPLLHYAYNAMERLLPTAASGGTAIVAMANALGQTLLDCFVLDTLFLAITFVATGIGEGYYREILPQLKSDFVPTLRKTWALNACLSPVQFVLFRFFPPSLRVLGVNAINVVWDACISYMIHRRRRKPENAQS